MCSFTCSRRTTRETGFGVLTGHPPMVCERVEGVWGNREVPPHEAKEGGNVGETWFPPRERAEGERRSCRHPRVEVAGGDVVFADREELRPDDALSEGGVAAGPERAAVDRP